MVITHNMTSGELKENIHDDVNNYHEHVKIK